MLILTKIAATTTTTTTMTLVTPMMYGHGATLSGNEII